MSTYRERREAKAARLREWADKREAKGAADLKRADEIAEMIPFGQPILVGHHSEGRHRRDAERIQSGMSRGVENLNKADEFRARADNIERAADKAIYSDDPDATDRLRDKVESLEERLALMKDANTKARKNQPFLADLPSDLQAEAAKNFKFWPGGTDIPFPNVKNVSATASRNRKRLAALESA